MTQDDDMPVTIDKAKTLIKLLEKVKLEILNSENGEEQGLQHDLFERIDEEINALSSEYKIDSAGLLAIKIDVKNSVVRRKPVPKIKPFIPYYGWLDLKIRDFNAETEQSKCQIYKAESSNPPNGTAKFTFSNLAVELVFFILSRLFPTTRVLVEKEHVTSANVYQVKEVLGVDGAKVKSDLFADDICAACPISKQFVIDKIGKV